MRARGAQGADIVILVVAADDGVKPQTKEAIAHAQAAQVPIIVALNKMDKPNANPDNAKKQLGELNLVPDEWGGSTIMVPVSAKEKTGIDDLLEAILLVADNTDIRANPKGKVIGTVIEAERDKTKGVMATLLVQNGTLKRQRCCHCRNHPWKNKSHVRFSRKTDLQSQTIRTGIGVGFE